MGDVFTRRGGDGVSEVTTLVIARGGPDGVHDETFEIPYHDGLTLLDAILYIRRERDSSIAVRFSCKANACKECSATIDGKPAYLCAVRATPGATTRIEPLRKPRLIRDLVTELY